MSVQPPKDVDESAQAWSAFRREPSSPQPRGTALRRRRRVLVVGLALLIFLLASVWLARFLSNENSERDAVVSLLRAQVAGNADAMLDRLEGCRKDPACVSTVKRNASSERGSGGVQILALSSPTAYSLTPTKGETRIAWRAGAGKPVVQCVVVERTGNGLTGLAIELRSISAPIPSESDCPPGSKPPIVSEPAEGP